MRAILDTSTIDRMEIIMRLIRGKQVKHRTGFSLTHIRRLEEQGLFPKKVYLGPKSVAWIDEEVDAWVKARVAERDAREHRAA